MSGVRIVQWVLLAMTAGLMVALRWLHLGITHYNWFIIILLSWSLLLIVSFRFLKNDLKGNDKQNT